MAVAQHVVPQPKTRIGARFAFQSAENVLASAILVMVIAGVISIVLGQDRNPDLRNYHLYNAHAYLAGRIGIDLAPAGMQTYFPPLLDVPYYWMALHLPAWLTAFLMGAWHGLSFIFLSGIAWKALAGDPHRARRAPLLGAAGMLSAAFLSEIGNTMGNASTAPWVLAALYLCLGDDRLTRKSHLAIAGLCLGIAVGLKLTNAIYAVALAVSLLLSPLSWRMRMTRLSIMAGVSLLSSAFLTAAWFHQVDAVFGNPLLPQFNAWFKSPLASQTLISDTRWLPTSWSERVAWPLLMTWEPGRVSESDIRQVAWPLLQALVLCWLSIVVIRRSRDRSRDGIHAISNQVVAFVVTAFVVWMLVFSIHRYLLVAEMLAPVAIWLVAHRAFAMVTAVRIGKLAIVASVVVAVLCWNTWGHARFAARAFEVEAPEVGNTPPATVLMTGQEPQAWMIPLLPATYHYVGLGATSFPEGPGYLPRARSIWEATPGRLFAILPAAEDRKQLRVDRVNRLLTSSGLDRHCGVIRGLAGRSRYEVVGDTSPGSDKPGCSLSLPSGARMDVASEDERTRTQAVQALKRYSLQLQEASCRRRRAWIGADLFPYQWCRVTPVR